MWFLFQIFSHSIIIVQLCCHIPVCCWIILHVCQYHILFIHNSSVCKLWVALYVGYWDCCQEHYTFLFECLFSFFFGIYLDRELLHHMVILYSAYWKNLTCFPVSAPFAVKPVICENSSFSTSTCYCPFSFIIMSILANIKWYQFDSNVHFPDY